MTKGYVLINIEPGREMHVYQQLMKLKGASDVSPLLGDIDFIIILETNNPNDIADIVVKKIRTIQGVVSTKTMIQDDFVKNFESLVEGY
jgi:DNA-binding Lrp family transcriptional regulator